MRIDMSDYAKTNGVRLSLFHDNPSSTEKAEIFNSQEVLTKLKALDARARKKGFDGLDPARSPLVAIGMEFNRDGVVQKNSYGVFNLAWQAAEHPEWPGIVMQELAALKKRIRDAHGTPLKFVIWAGMGGSAEDKSMYNAVGLLRRAPKVYVLDSTDPAKLKHILESMTARGGSLNDALKATLVVGMAMGMTSYEPVVNLKKIAALYEKLGVDSRPNIVYMTLPTSLLDQFGKAQGYQKIELQLDGGNSTAGRHSAPLTRGSLYPLGLCGMNLEDWIDDTNLSDDEVQEAFRLSAFLYQQAKAGRGMITLLLPKSWGGAALWTKQNFEESLGKSEDFGLKIVIGERVKLANYRAPKDPAQNRCFLAVHAKPLNDDGARKVASLKRAGYPVAVLNLKSASLARYMQAIHYVVFGIGYLQRMNFVTQPSVELYKAITSRIFEEATERGAIERTEAWKSMANSPRKYRYSSGVTLYCDRLPDGVVVQDANAVSVYANVLRQLASERRIEYGELTFFGDTRYNPAGRSLRKTLDRAGDRVFRTALKMPVDVYEGPAMNHSYHEMVIGHGRCFSTVLLSEKAEKLGPIDYPVDYHRAQFLATQMALAERGRHVVSLMLKDLDPATQASLDDFFREVAAALRSVR